MGFLTDTNSTLAKNLFMWMMVRQGRAETRQLHRIDMSQDAYWMVDVSRVNGLGALGQRAGVSDEQDQADQEAPMGKRHLASLRR